MSIIYDALKKVQAKIEKNSKNKTLSYALSEDTAILPPPRIPKSFLNPVLKPVMPSTQRQNNIQSTAAGLTGQTQYQRTLIALCGVICVVLIFLIGYLMYLFGITRPNDTAGKARNFDEIVLQGIMIKDDKNVALINDEIYEVGETIKGKQILQIGVNSIQIKDRWKVKTLFVKQKPN